VAIIKSVLIVSLVLLFFGKRSVNLLIMVLLIIGTVIYLTVDPHLSLFNVGSESVTTYMMRSQTQEEIINLTGRTQLWGQVWNSFLDSPIIGHGYLSISESGKLDIWGREGDITAHNLLLQILANNGLIGLILVIWGLLKAYKPAIINVYANLRNKKIAFFSLIIACDFLIKGILGISFLGAIRPWHLAFFITLGMSAGLRDFKKD
jgi:O-antigen ligase